MRFPGEWPTRLDERFVAFLAERSSDAPGSGDKPWAFAISSTRGADELQSIEASGPAVTSKEYLGW